jgi:hypothetical protein
MNRRCLISIFLFLLLLAVMPLFSACANKEKEAQPNQVILEPGFSTPGDDTTNQPVTPAPEPQPAASGEDEGDEDEEAFIDLGRASTLDDLMANKEKIHSYYFEQTVNASYGEMSVQTWYADGWMKIVNIFSDGEENIDYINCEHMFSISLAPATRDYGILMYFEPDDPDMPENYLSNDYHQYRVVDTESINGQNCRVLESRQGKKLWVSTKYGFPLQVEFTDPTNEEHFIITYENIIFNQTRYEDVAVPADTELIQY